MVKRDRWPPALFVVVLLVVRMLEAQPSHAQAGSWTLQTVAAPKELASLTARSLQLDAAGRPHVAYGGDHLYYAWYDGTAWHSQVVDQGPQTGGDPSLALDAAGRPRIAYLDAASQALKYATHDGSGWQVSVLAAGLGSLFTMVSLGSWYTALAKPSWNPPSWVFGPVWTVLYAMMAVAGWLVWRRGGPGARTALQLFTVQLVLNVGWSAVFFGLQMPGLAFAEILVLRAAIAATRPRPPDLSRLPRTSAKGTPMRDAWRWTSRSTSRSPTVTSRASARASSSSSRWPSAWGRNPRRVSCA